jgi:hypothetical protein
MEQVERDLQRISRERLLPGEKILEKVARDETHLSRGLYKILHELEACGRDGRVVPLPRCGSTWTDWWRAERKAFTQLFRGWVFSEVC